MVVVVVRFSAITANDAKVTFGCDMIWLIFQTFPEPSVKRKIFIVAM